SCGVRHMFRRWMREPNFADPLSHRRRLPGAKRFDHDADNAPRLAARFLEPHGLVWGEFAAPDGAKLRWGNLPAANPRVECVMVGGFTECIEKYFETMVDLAARGLSVWYLYWLGQGGSGRPRRSPSRPRPRRYNRDANDLTLFAKQ